MIIRDDESFDGIFDGADIEGQVKDYMDMLRRYQGGEIFVPEKKVYEKRKVPSVRRGYKGAYKFYPDRDYMLDMESKEFAVLAKDKRQKIEKFWREEHRRMNEGYDGMCGLQYGYFNWARLHGGKGPVKYRRHDNDMFHLVESCTNGKNRIYKDNKGWGIIEVGRRRSGKSAKGGWMMVNFARTDKDSSAICTSKTEDDAQKMMLEKIHFPYHGLPSAIRPSAIRVSMGELALGRRDGLGGRNTKVETKAPKPTSIEGSTLKFWWHDEGPKTNGLLPLVDMTLPALADADGFHREGFVYITGVAGDFDAHGDDFIELWRSATDYKLIRWFSPGWVGLCADEKGNEDVEAAVRMILTERHNILNNARYTQARKERLLHNKMQQYPLTVEESFLRKGGSLFNVQELTRRKNSLLDDPVEVRAYQVKVKNGTPVIAPHSTGNIQILEMPKSDAYYTAAIDAYGVKQANTGSEGAMTIWKLASNLPDYKKNDLFIQLNKATSNKEKYKIHQKLGNYPVVLFKAAYKNPEKFAREAVELMLFYNHNSKGNAKILCEVQPETIFKYISDNNANLLFPSPLKQGKRYHSKAELTNRMGLKMDAYWAEARLDVLRAYTDDYTDFLYFPDLIEHLISYHPDNRKYDDIDAMGINLILNEDERLMRMVNYGIDNEEEEDSYATNLMGFRRT